MQPDTSTDRMVESIRRMTALATRSEAGLEYVARLRLLRRPAAPMPWHLRARRALAEWLFAWKRHQDDAFAAELQRQVSQLRARDLDKP